MNASATICRESGPAYDWTEVKVRCPRCAGMMEIPTRLDDPRADRQECARCGSAIHAIDGIWRAIEPGRASQLEASLSAYEAVREAEGRWSQDPEFYQSLPWRDTTDRFREQWGIRARSFDFVRDHVLPDFMNKLGRQRLRVLDLGAGNCWLSYRLALYGHYPVAVDIGVGRKDGLGAATHFRSVLGQLFPRFQAEMDWLPFADDQFDLAVYNASFHYAQDYETTARKRHACCGPMGQS